MAVVGGSTGTAMWGAVQLVGRMREDGERGSVVTLLCDSGERYQSRYYDDAWLAAEERDLTPYTAELDAFLGHVTARVAPRDPSAPP